MTEDEQRGRWATLDLEGRREQREQILRDAQAQLMRNMVEAEVQRLDAYERGTPEDAFHPAMTAWETPHTPSIFPMDPPKGRAWSYISATVVIAFIALLLAVGCIYLILRMLRLV
jgi:hypothetical protein